MRNIALAVLAAAFGLFVTFSGALVAMNHPSNAKTSAAIDGTMTIATGAPTAAAY